MSCLPVSDDGSGSGTVRPIVDKARARGAWFFRWRAGLTAGRHKGGRKRRSSSGVGVDESSVRQD